MSLRTLPKGEWKDYFDAFSRRLPAAKVEVDVSGLDLGDQVEAKDALLEGITYDPADDALEIFLKSGTHVVPRPGAIQVDDEGGVLREVAVVDGDGHTQRILITAAASLPAT